MKPLVSIIIPEIKDDTYLVRCINSIKRQTYQNIEIIMPRREEKLEKQKIDKVNTYREFIERAQGKYLFFCNVTSVLAADMVKILVEKTENDPETCYSSVVYERNDKNEYINLLGTTLSWSYKLLEKQCLEYLINDYEKEEKKLFSIAQYLAEKKVLKWKSTAIVYENEKYDLYTDMTSEDLKGINDIVQKLSKIDVNKEEIKETCRLLIENQKNLYARICIIYTIGNWFEKDLEWNYQLAKRFVKEIYETAKKDKNEKLFEAVKSYVLFWQKKEEFFKIILKVLNIADKKELFLTNSLEEFLFFSKNSNLFLEEDVKKFHQESWQKQMKEVSELTILQNQLVKKEDLKTMQNQCIQKEEQQILQLKSDIEQMKETLNTFFKQEKNATILSGPELAEFVVERYRNGNLGFKTILRSIGMWIKYKLRRGK